MSFQTQPNKNSTEKEKILLSLYKDDKIDKILNKDNLSYLEFSKLKRNNDLNLARVNELHSEIKKFINISKTNVSTKYLNDYILFFN